MLYECQNNDVHCILSEHLEYLFTGYMSLSNSCAMPIWVKPVFMLVDMNFINKWLNGLIPSVSVGS